MMLARARARVPVRAPSLRWSNACSNDRMRSARAFIRLRKKATRESHLFC